MEIDFRVISLLYPNNNNLVSLLLLLVVMESTQIQERCFSITELKYFYLKAGHGKWRGCGCFSASNKNIAVEVKENKVEKHLAFLLDEKEKKFQRLCKQLSSSLVVCIARKDKNK